MEFLFFISGAVLVLISIVFGYAMGERKSDKLAANDTIAERKGQQ